MILMDIVQVVLGVIVTCDEYGKYD